MDSLLRLLVNDNFLQLPFLSSLRLFRDPGILNRYSCFWKSLNMVDRDGEFSFFLGIHVRSNISISMRPMSCWLMSHINVIKTLTTLFQQGLYSPNFENTPIKLRLSWMLLMEDEVIIIRSTWLWKNAINFLLGRDRKSYSHQIWAVGLLRAAGLVQTDFKDTDDIIGLRSRGCEKMFWFIFNKGYDYQNWKIWSRRKPIKNNLRTSDGVTNMRSHEFDKTLTPFQQGLWSPNINSNIDIY